MKIPSGEATIGPFFPPRYVDAGANDLTQLDDRKAEGEAIEIFGVVRQEDGAPLDNLVLEIWQADANGIYRHPADPRHREADPKFLGWGRAATDKEGRYAFRTIRPGAPQGRARARELHADVLGSHAHPQDHDVLSRRDGERRRPGADGGTGGAARPARRARGGARALPLRPQAARRA
jgi:protocatechuate 3,4-dioxygenase beta subunit